MMLAYLFCISYQSQPTLRPFHRPYFLGETLHLHFKVKGWLLPLACLACLKCNSITSRIQQKIKVGSEGTLEQLKLWGIISTQLPKQDNQNSTLLKLGKTFSGTPSWSYQPLSYELWGCTKQIQCQLVFIYESHSVQFDF